MKRAKLAKVTIEKYTGESYSVMCPHCRTLCCGGFNHDVIRLKCYSCKEEIILKW
jgi:hypothetical protein